MLAAGMFAYMQRRKNRRGIARGSKNFKLLRSINTGRSNSPNVN
jgi:hypothetical protein